MENTFTKYESVNHALENLTRVQRHCYFVTADGLTANPDGPHFDAISLHRFGIRYFRSFHERRNIVMPLIDEMGVMGQIWRRPLTATERRAILKISFASGKITIEEFEKELAKLNY